MNYFKMNMMLSTTGSNRNTPLAPAAPGAPVVALIKMGSTTKRNCARLNIQGNKYCKSCSGKK